MSDISNNDDWKEVDGENTAYFPENQMPSSVNNGMRAVQGSLKRFWNRINGVANLTGTNNYTGTITGLSSYADCERIRLSNGTANTTEVTINLNGLGAKPVVYYNEEPLAAGAFHGRNEVSYRAEIQKFVLIDPKVLPVTMGGTGAASGAQGLINLGINNFVPTGTIIMFGAGTPTGYLYCDGTAYSRTTYAGLFNVIGGLWGSGDGWSNFNVPDFRGRSPIGAGQGPGLVNNYGLNHSYGEETHVLSWNEMPVHSHSAGASGQTANHTHSGSTDVQGNHYHNISIYTSSTAGGGSGNEMRGGNNTTTDWQGNHAHNFSTGGVSSDHSHYISVDNAGGSWGHQNVHPIRGVYFMIKT